MRHKVQRQLTRDHADSLWKVLSLLASLFGVIATLAAEFAFNTTVLGPLHGIKQSGTLLFVGTAVALAVLIGVFSLPIASAVRKVSGTVRVFISYPHVVQNVAVDIARELRAKGVKVWLDIERIRPGDSIQSSIERGIEDADVCVFILPPEMTPNSRRELEMALERRVKVIPVIASEAADMPKELTGISHVNLLDHPDEGIRQIVNAVA